MKTNILLTIAIAFTIIFSTSCKKTNEDPQPSQTYNNGGGNNNGGGGNTEVTYFTDPIHQDFACDELFETCNFRGHNFTITEGGCPTPDDVTYRQYFAGKNGTWQISPTHATGEIVKKAGPELTYKIIADAITANGSFKVPQSVNDNQVKYGIYDATLAYGYQLKLSTNTGYDVDNNRFWGTGWSVNVNTTDEYYFEITKITRKYPKVYNNPEYVIEGNKRILIREENVDGMLDEVLTSTFKTTLSLQN
jgi:hypothetical protein